MPDCSPQPTAIVVDFEPIGRRVQVEPGKNLMQAAQESGLGLVALCGGEGWCESCIVRVESGRLQPPTDAERLVFTQEYLDRGHRLACQAIPLGDARIYIPPESLNALQRLQIEGRGAPLAIDPLVQVLDLRLERATLQDLRGDDLRLRQALAELGAPDVTIDSLPVLEALSTDLRAQDWRVRAVLREGELIATLPVGGAVFGLAVDIGTTKLAAYLLNLFTGETVAKAGAMNPQIAFGEDVITRIAHAQKDEAGRALLQTRVVEALNELAAGLCREAGVTARQIVQAVVVGNTAMHHLFARLPVAQLARAPYVPSVAGQLTLSATELGLKIAPGAQVEMLPNIAGFVGSDHVAVLLSTELGKTDSHVIAIDIGTNTEITLASAGRLFSCSCPSGPAFEGAHIRDGMRAAPGAIEHVQIREGEVFVSTIDNAAPVGICGSGILDAVAELRRTGVLDEKGAILPGHAGVEQTDGGLQYVLVPAEKTGHGRAITISRKDINEILLAKAAIRTGLDVLLEQAALPADAVDEVLVAGAFGTYIDIPAALAIGMFPPIPNERFKQIGNAAGMGARQALLSGKALAESAVIARRVQYVELTNQPGFQERFLKAMYIPAR